VAGATFWADSFLPRHPVLEGFGWGVATGRPDFGVDLEAVDAGSLAFDLGDRFTGAASFHMLHHIPTVEDQDRAFAELARVVTKGGFLVVADGVFSEGSQAFHAGDTYNPIDPDTLSQRLSAVGFTSVSVQLHDLGWFCTGTAAG
jgi:SAM-dependent methyltransferase